MKFLFAIALAAVASSTNYQIQVDSLNFGGLPAASTNYQTSDTLGEVATGGSSSSSYQIKAGYQQMLGSSISISAPSDLALSGIQTTTGGQSSGSVTWTVTTDNTGGYTLAIKSATSPALKSGGNGIDDYAPSGAVPDYAWSVAGTTAKFGFSVTSTDAPTRYLNNGSACDVGAITSTSNCWDGLSTTNRTIASRTTSNTPSGTATTVKFQAEVGSTASVTAGDYRASVTATALAS